MKKKDASRPKKKVMARTASQSLIPKPKKVENLFMVRQLNLGTLKKSELQQPVKVTVQVERTQVKPNTSVLLHKPIARPLRIETIPRPLNNFTKPVNNKSQASLPFVGKSQALYFVGFLY